MTTAAAGAATGLALFIVLASIASTVGIEGYKPTGITVSPADSCGGDYDDIKGVITSPNYPSNYPEEIYCVWKLKTPPNTRITVTFEDFKTANENDYLEIRDGNNNSSQLIETCYGTSCDDVTSSRNTLYLYFHSRGSYVDKGFKLVWFSDPGCGEHYTGTKGAIASVDYPNKYPDDLDCVYTLMSPANTKITVDFESFNTYNSSDYLQIRDGPDSSSLLLGRCSGSSCESARSSNNTLYIHFHTSSEDRANGFKLSWYSGFLDDIFCYYCDSGPDSDHYDPACPEDNYGGQGESSERWNSCYTNVHYDGSHRIERGGTENYEEDGQCFDSGYSYTCYCMRDYCNNRLCQNCTSTTPPSIITTTSRTTSKLPPSTTTIHSSSITITNPTTTFTPSIPTTSQAPTPVGSLQCYSCINCEEVDESTHVDTSDEFLSCFTAIELGASHFVIRGGSPDLYGDGSCRHEDGAFICYCSTNLCNSDAAVELLEYN